MKKKKYLPLYYEWMETGELPNGGLCGSLNDHRLLYLFLPQSGLGWYSLYDGGKFQTCCTERGMDREFTTLRQTVMLFMAAMNGEL